MAEAAIIINVSDQEWTHGNGLSGMHVVRAKADNEEFSVLVVYPTPEIQDIGDNKKTVHWLKAKPLALDIVGARSDESKEKWGLLVCEEEPDVPKALDKAIEAEREFLDANPPDVKYRKSGNLMVATNIEEMPIKEEKVRLSKNIKKLRDEFEAQCRKLVKKSEVEKAKSAMLREDQRLIVQGDQMWAQPNEQKNIDERHRRACRRLGQERPWCYSPQELVDCPGCSKKIKPDAIVCGSCGAMIDHDLADYPKMTREERARALYPERFAEEADSNLEVTGKKK